MKDSEKTKTQLLKEMAALRKKVATIEKTTKESDKLNTLFHLILENTPIFVGQIDKNGKYIKCRGSVIMRRDIKKCDTGCGCIYESLPEFKEYIGRALQGEFIGFTHHGDFNGKKWWLQTNLFPDIHNKGEVINITYDITDIMLAQEDARLRQAQLIQADKMTSLGALVAGIAHEINNPNMFIGMGAGNLALFFDEVSPVLDSHFKNHPDWKVGGRSFEEAKEKILSIFSGLQDGSKRISNIIAALKNFAKPDSGNLNKSVDINSAIESSVEILRNIIKKTTDHFSVDLNRSIPECKGNHQQIEQVIINLITNACQALTNKQQSITVTTSYDPYMAIVKIQVIDTGCGIAQDNLARISEPFYTTKQFTGGLGIGLSITFDIIKRHKGTITYSSKEKEGTTATVQLPCY